MPGLLDLPEGGLEVGAIRNKKVLGAHWRALTCRRVQSGEQVAHVWRVLVWSRPALDPRVHGECIVHAGARNDGASVIAQWRQDELQLTRVPQPVRRL